MNARLKKNFLTYGDIKKTINTEYHAKKQWYELKRTVTGPESHIAEFEVMLENEPEDNIVSREKFDALLTEIEKNIQKTQRNKRSGKTFSALENLFNHSLQFFYRKFQVDLSVNIHDGRIDLSEINATEEETENVIIPFLECCNHIHEVAVRSKAFQGRGLEMLVSQLKQHSLSLSSVHSDNTLIYQCISGNPNIKNLKLSLCKISKKQAEILTALLIEKLSISPLCKIKHVSLMRIASTNTIRTLEITLPRMMGMHSEMIEALASNTVLHTLKLHGSKGHNYFGKEGKKLLASTTLQQLHLFGFYLDKEDITTLALNYNLVQIKLEWCGLSDEVKTAFQENNFLKRFFRLRALNVIPLNTPFPSLKTLSLFHVKRLPNIDLNQLPCDLRTSIKNL